MEDKRKVVLQKLYRLLNTDDGKLLMREMFQQYDKEMWGAVGAEHISYYAGQRDVYKYLQLIQTGDLINE